MDDNDRYALSTTTPTVCPYCGCTEFNDRWQDGTWYNFPEEERTFRCGYNVIGKGIPSRLLCGCRYDAERRQREADEVLPDFWYSPRHKHGGGPPGYVKADDELIVKKAEAIERKEQREYAAKRQAEYDARREKYRK